MQVAHYGRAKQELTSFLFHFQELDYYVQYGFQPAIELLALFRPKREHCSKKIGWQILKDFCPSCGCQQDSI